MDRLSRQDLRNALPEIPRGSLEFYLKDLGVKPIGREMRGRHEVDLFDAAVVPVLRERYKNRKTIINSK